MSPWPAPTNYFSKNAIKEKITQKQQNKKEKIISANHHHKPLYFRDNFLSKYVYLRKPSSSILGASRVPSSPLYYTVTCDFMECSIFYTNSEIDL